jgi:hypothetical protein
LYPYCPFVSFVSILFLSILSKVGVYDRFIRHLSHLFSKTNKCHCDWIWIKRSSSLAFHAYRVCNYFEQILHSSRTTNRDPHKEPPSIFVLTSACGLVIRSNHQTFQTINFINYMYLCRVACHILI